MSDDQIKLEVSHIFESGANEIRIVELIKSIIGKTNENVDVVEKFVDRIINGSTGFKIWEEREFVVFKDRDKGIAEFVIRCLANPECEGSDAVLSAIQHNREEKQTGSTAFEITDGLVFRSTQFEGNCVAYNANKDKNTVQVAIIINNGSRIEEWDLQHTIWGFERGDYYECDTSNKEND